MIIFKWPLQVQRKGFPCDHVSSSCWRLIPLAVPYSCDILVGKDLSEARHETTVDRYFIRRHVSSKAFFSMNCAMKQNMEGTLSAWGDYTMITDKVSGMKAAIMSRSDGTKC